MRIRSSVEAINGISRYNANNLKIKKTTERLSLGKKINRSVDDASGMAISQKMRGQINGLNQSGDNIKEGIDLTNVAESAINDQITIIKRVKQLAIRGSNGVYDENDRSAIQSEIDSLMDEYSRISEGTIFNGTSLLEAQGVSDNSADMPVMTEYEFDFSKFNMEDVKNLGDIEITDKNGDRVSIIRCSSVPGKTEDGVVNVDSNVSTVSEFVDRFASALRETGMNVSVDGGKLRAKSYAKNAQSDINPLKFSGLDENPGYTTNIVKIKCGANSDDNNYISVEINQTSIKAIFNDDIDFSVNDELSSRFAIQNCETALEYLSDARSKMGYYANRMEHAFNNANYSSINTESSCSRIEDADMAKEMMEHVKTSILQTATESMMVHYKSESSKVMQLLY